MAATTSIGVSKSVNKAIADAPPFLFCKAESSIEVGVTKYAITKARGSFRATGDPFGKLEVRILVDGKAKWYPVLAGDKIEDGTGRILFPV